MHAPLSLQRLIVFPALFPPCFCPVLGAALMVAVGTGSVLGGVWRSPPLALAEFSTSPAELLNPHALFGLRAMLDPGAAARACLPAAVRAQALRCAALEMSIRHNQVGP